VSYTIGRLATWLTFPCVVYLLLAFPHGRIEKGLDRALFFGVVGVMLLLFFGTAPFVAAFPPKTLWSTCTTDCPANALFVFDEQPAFLTKVILVRELADRAAVARAVLLDVSPLARGVPAAAAGDESCVHRRDAARPVSLRAHHGASTRRAGRHGDRALLGVDALHHRRVRGLSVRARAQTDAARRRATRSRSRAPFT
jgi:hypothetical protein